MGLFSRKDPDPVDGQQGRARVPLSSEVQAAQWRGRARRRLVGAVALVLAAVVVLPMVLDSEPVPVASDIPIVIPDRKHPHVPKFNDAHAAASAETASSTEDAAAQPIVINDATPAASAPETPATPARASESEPERTDDGRHALALLEGRVSPQTPRASNALSNSTYVLQLAAYNVRNDAMTRRDKLQSAGVGNAFVEQATVNNRTQYRLRIGPFPTRAAAQAAQAQLRKLGYDNGFIAAQ